MPMAATRAWTLEELHRLPDDGNKYELLYGELLVTPAPSVSHEAILARLTELLTPYARTHRLGHVLRARAVIQQHNSEVEPDLMVRDIPDESVGWDAVPVPILVVEVSSPSTRRRNWERKRKYYSEIGVPEYWIVDRDRSTITVLRHGEPDVAFGESLTWAPAGASAPNVIDVAWVLRGGSFRRGLKASHDATSKTIEPGKVASSLN